MSDGSAREGVALVYQRGRTSKEALLAEYLTGVALADDASRKALAFGLDLVRRLEVYEQAQKLAMASGVAGAPRIVEACRETRAALERDLAELTATYETLEVGTALLDAMAAELRDMGVEVGHV